MRRFLLLPFLLLGLAFVPASASAADYLTSTMMDDDQLLYRGDETRDATLKRMKSMGVDYARISVLWEVVAEDARKGKKRKRRFDGAKPRTYPKTNWDRYDRLVRAANALRIGVYMNVTGPGPKWAHRRAPKGEARSTKRAWMPREKEYGKFVEAVAKRYDGTYKDENDYRTILPRVQFWSLWNEPNQAGWLTPQWKDRVPMAPIIYRDLWIVGRRALDDTGHGRDVILLGETAPIGDRELLRDARGHLHPKVFIRELFCIRPDGTKYTGAAAAKRKCSRLNLLGGGYRSFAFAHHPYTKTLAPTQRDEDAESLTMANIGELAPLLKQVQEASGIGGPTQSIMTEYGYETDPPDPHQGISPAKQAEYINLGEYIAYKDPSIIGQAQFLLRDTPPRRSERKNTREYWFTYQSGLFNINGSPKPSATAYVMPLLATGRATDANGVPTVGFWGAVRFMPFGSETSVFLQHRPAGAQQFENVGEPVPVPGTGYYETAVPERGPGTWRAVWLHPLSGAAAHSREVEVK
jgi:hypothetical protein